MTKIKRIIFPTDFSPAAANGLEYAISVALDYNAKIFLVHVIENIGFNAAFTLTSTPVIDQYHYEMEESARKQLQKLASPELKERIEVEEVVAEGKAFLEILRIAKERNADLIVMATHGRTGKKHVHLGSTSERVISQAPCPVLVVRDHALEELFHPEAEAPSTPD